MSERTGTYTLEQADSGTIRVRDVPGTNGISHTVVVTMAISGLPVSDPTLTIQMFPSGAFSQGSDENGNIGIGVTFTPDASDDSRTTWNSTWSGIPLNFPDGLNNQEFRTVVNFVEDVDVEWSFQFGDYDLATDFPVDLDDPVINEDVENIEFNEEEEVGSAIITFDYTGDDDPTGFVTEYYDDVDDTWYPDADVPRNDDDHYTVPTYTFDVPSDFPIRVTPYKITPDTDDWAKGPPSPTIPVSWDVDTPDINFTGGQDGFIDLGGAATIVLAADPSGIYTLVPGKTNDTLYDRDVTPVGTIDVKIPDPFLKTGFLE
jgi:hypothetical protein